MHLKLLPLFYFSSTIDPSNQWNAMAFTFHLYNQIFGQLPENSQFVYALVYAAKTLRFHELGGHDDGIVSLKCGSLPKRGKHLDVLGYDPAHGYLAESHYDLYATLHVR